MTQNDGGKYHCETYNNQNITRHVFVSVFDKMEVKLKVPSSTSKSSENIRQKSQLEDRKNYVKKREKKPMNADSFVANKGPILLLIKPLLSFNFVSIVMWT